MAYDFKNLDPIDFEELSNDLLSKHFKVRVERYKPGKDGGVDGKFFVAPDEKCIIQSKHYASSKLSDLLSTLKNTELEKVKRIAPGRYIVSTSLPLSPNDKSKIVQTMLPYIKSTSDVFGKEDLNALLVEYPSVQKSHYKLWIKSSAVLERFLNAATYNLSEQIVQEAVSRSSHYVTTAAHNQALDKLENNNTLVVTGEPGVGKTTLVEQVCLRFVAKEYELVVIDKDIQEARALFKKGQKQIFYFDDFLGRNFLEALRFKEDSQIMQFVQLIKISKNKKFILTSRTNILDRGYSLGQFNSPHRLKNREFLLDIKQYSPEERARILYSFMWRSGLTQDHLEEIVHDKKYMSIIMHKNYNPRILEFITSQEMCLNKSREEYGRFVLGSLDNPIDVWDNPYTVQIDDLSRAMVDLVVLSNSLIEEDSLRYAYGKFKQGNSYAVAPSASTDFDDVARTLSRTFIDRSELKTWGANGVPVPTTRYSTFNPSVSDYVLNKYKKDKFKFSEMVMCYKGCEGLRLLDKMSSEDKELVTSVSDLIVEKLGYDAFFEKSYEYIFRIGCLLSDSVFEKLFQAKPLDYLLSGISSCDSLEHSLSFSDRFIELQGVDSDGVSKVFAEIFKSITRFYELEEASSYAFTYDWDDPKFQELQKVFYEALMAVCQDDYYVADFIGDNIDDYSSFDEFCDDHGWCEEDINVDDHGLALHFVKSTNDLFCPIEYDDAVEIINSYDLKDIVRDNHKEDGNVSLSSGRPTVNTANIDDMFEGFLESKYGN